MESRLDEFSWHLASEFRERMPFLIEGREFRDRYLPLIQLDGPGDQSYPEIREFLGTIFDLPALLDAVCGSRMGEAQLRRFCFRQPVDITEAQSEERTAAWEISLHEHAAEQERLDSRLFKARRADPESDETQQLNREAVKHSRSLGWKAQSERRWKAREWSAFCQFFREQIKEAVYRGCISYWDSLLSGAMKQAIFSPGRPQPQKQPALAKPPLRLADRIRQEYDYPNEDLIEVLLAVAWRKAGKRDNAKLAAIMTNKAKIHYSDGKTPKDHQRANPAAFRSRLARLRRKAKSLGFDHLVTADYLSCYVSRRVGQRVGVGMQDAEE